jgi:hypothetical protein
VPRANQANTQQHLPHGSWHRRACVSKAVKADPVPAGWVGPGAAGERLMKRESQGMKSVLKCEDPKQTFSVQVFLGCAPACFAVSTGVGRGALYP